MGIDFKAEEEFPPDDTGYGFDNIGDVLSVSPLLLEKYFQAAEAIVKTAVPTASKLTPERSYRGVEFRGAEKSLNGDRLAFSKAGDGLALVRRRGRRRLSIAARAGRAGALQARPGPLHGRVQGRRPRAAARDLYRARQQDVPLHHRRAPDRRRAQAGLRAQARRARRPAAVDLRIVSVRVEGPLDAAHRVKPPGYGRFFPRDEAPTSGPERRRICPRGARPVRRAGLPPPGRRPDARSPGDDRRVGLPPAGQDVRGRRRAGHGGRPGLAPLPVPRRGRRSPAQSGRPHAPIDEYALASRLSYFLWSTMPDDELFELAGEGRLRAELPRQVKRMLADARGKALTQNFVGQWLEVRDLDGMYFNERAILRREGVRLKGADTERNVLTRDIRRAMRSETEMAFEYVAREDRSILEWVDCDYTFLNARLAKHYGIPGVEGSEMRKVTLPKDSPRGGVLTHGSILAVTSNPARTSPVKRGQFILDNILGTPAPPPPPDIPALEASKKDFKDREPTTRELMALHRSKPLCSACHSRMDPLGLALDNFNPLGTLARAGGEAADRRLGQADHRRVVPRRPRPEEDPQGAASPRLLPLRHREAADLRPGARSRVRRRRDGRPDRRSSRPGWWPVLRPADGRDRIVAVPAEAERRRTAGGPDPRFLPDTVRSVRFDTTPDTVRPMKPDHPHDEARRPAARQPEPPPLPPGGGRLDGAAGLRVAAAEGRRGRRRRRCRALPATTRDRGPAADGVRLRPQRRQPVELVAQEGGEGVRAQPHHAAAGAGQGPDPGDLRAGSAERLRRQGRAGRPRPRLRDLPDRGPRQEDRRRRHPRRGLGRPGRRAGGRSPDAVPLAGAGLRRRAQVGQLRLRVFVRLPVQPLVGLAQHADDARGQPPLRLRAALRRRVARRARQEPAAAAGAAAVDPRLRARRHPRPGRRAGLARSQEAG